MPGEYMQTIKVAMAFIASSFVAGTVWSTWIYDYPVLQHLQGSVEASAEHYYRRAIVGGVNYELLTLIPVFIGVIGLSAGITLMEEHNLFFDGVCMLALIFGISTYSTSIAPGLESLVKTGVKGMTSTEDAQSLFEIVTKIAAGNIIIICVAGGIAVLQFIHFILLKRWAYNEKHAASQQVAPEKKSQ
ncbi:hypothetical protein BGW37DRAFT_498484 [Umbelopsis sp. PMI_123]|nr:hypothetical protein BGW37DRAFT_498484 [Umbelopsis sp. PMI_123]